jgi:hypothetical protein
VVPHNHMTSVIGPLPFFKLYVAGLELSECAGPRDTSPGCLHDTRFIGHQTAPRLEGGNERNLAGL